MDLKPDEVHVDRNFSHTMVLGTLSGLSWAIGIDPFNEKGGEVQPSGGAASTS